MCGRLVLAAHGNDMSLLKPNPEESQPENALVKNDSLLANNVRPLILVFLTGATVLLAYTTIFFLGPEEVEMVGEWKDLLQTLLVTCYAFYFGSRGLEKVHKIKKG